MTQSPLELLARAIQQRDADNVRALIRNGSVVNLNARLPRKHDRNPPAIVFATRCRSREIVELLLDAGADVNATDDAGQSASHATASSGDIGLLELLHSRGANLALVDGSQFTPLEIALNDSLDATPAYVAKLLEFGSPIGDAQVQILLASLSTSCIQALIDAGVVVSALRDSFVDMNTPLHSAATRSGAREIIPMLVRECGIDVNVQNALGNTCCHIIAAIGGSLPVMRWLIGAGADVNIANRTGRTPLLEACTLASNAECVRWLLAAGANARAQSDGSTLCHAVVRGRAFDEVSDEILHLLLAAHADLDAADRSGTTSRQLLNSQTAFCIDPAKLESARRRIATAQLDFVRERALEVCIGLQSLQLDALQICEILVHACGPVAPLIAFHHWWKIVMIVKHFHEA